MLRLKSLHFLIKEDEKKLNDLILLYSENKKVISINCYQTNIKEEFYLTLDKLNSHENQIIRINKAQEFIKIILDLITIGLIIYIQDNLSFVLFLVHNLLSQISYQIISKIKNQQEYYVTNARMEEIMNLNIEKTFNQGKVGKLSFENIIYYQGNEIILDNLSFTFNQPTYIKGNDERAKKHIMNLILGLDRTYQGEITINGIKVDKFEEMGIKIGYLSAKPFLIEGGLLKNLSLGNNLAENQLIKKIKDFGLDIYLNKWNYQDDLDLKLLSNAEQELIVFIRLLLETNQLIIIDEGLEHVNDVMKKELLKLLISLHQTQVIILIGQSLERMIKELEIMIFDLNLLQNVV